MSVLRFGVLSVLAGVMVLWASSASAALLSFNWSFFDSSAGVTISGTVDGLQDNATGPASQVTITDDGDLTFFTPQGTIHTATSNVWEVLAGQIVSVLFESTGFDIGSDHLLLSGTAPDTFGQLDDGLIGATRSGRPVVFSPVDDGTPDAPEPFTAGLLGLGLVGLGLMRRRAA